MSNVTDNERWTMDRAADFLEHYAAYIQRVKPEDIEAHPYLPELEYVASQIRDWFGRCEAGERCSCAGNQQRVKCAHWIASSPNTDAQCNPHPDAPHGFNRNASHNAGRYVCDCEGWMPRGVDAPSLLAPVADPRLNIQSGPFKGKPQQWFTRAEVERLIAAGSDSMGKLISALEFVVRHSDSLTPSDIQRMQAILAEVGDKQ